jgi:exonuclease VII small subunit
MASTTIYNQASLPINVPRKAGVAPQPLHPSRAALSHLSASPPEVAESVTTGPSYDPSGTSSSYAASASDYDATTASVSGVDLMDYMGERLNGTFSTLPLDRGMAKQAQTSGELNAKTRQLQELQALARSRLAATRANFSDGMKAAKEVQRDLEWTQKRVASINQRAQKKYPTEFGIAAQRFPAPVDC